VPKVYGVIDMNVKVKVYADRVEYESRRLHTVTGQGWFAEGVSVAKLPKGFEVIVKPPSGFAPTDSNVKKTRINYEPIVIKHGMPHVHVRHGNYAPIINPKFTTKDFLKYYSGIQILPLNEIVPLENPIEVLGIVDGNTILYEFVDKGVALFAIANDGIYYREVSYVDFLEYAKPGEKSLDGFKKVLSGKPVENTNNSVTFLTDSGTTLKINPDNSVLVNGFISMRLSDFLRQAENPSRSLIIHSEFITEFSPVTDMDPIEYLRKTRKTDAFFSRDVAHPNRRTIITRRGIIKLRDERKLSKISDDALEVIKYILVLDSEIAVEDGGVHFEVDIDSMMVRLVHPLEGHRPATLRIGKSYFWNVRHPNIFENETNVRIVTSNDGGTHRVKDGLVYIQIRDPLPPSVVRKVINGENVALRDLLPGYSKDRNQDFNTHESLFNARDYSYELDVKYEIDGMVAKVLYKNGYYLLKVPYDNNVDIWRCGTVDCVPKEYIKEKIISYNFQDAKKIYTNNAGLIVFENEDYTLYLSMSMCCLSISHGENEKHVNNVSPVLMSGFLEKAWFMASAL